MKKRYAGPNPNISVNKAP